MTFLDTWRTNLKTHLAEFAQLAKEDRNINLIYGITAAAVLWGVRDAPFDDTQKSALEEACGDEKYLPHLIRAVEGWDAMTQLEAARSLSKHQRDSDELRDALSSLMGTFIEVLFEQNMVQRQHIDISESVIGGNIVIGGYQIVAGDLIIQYINPKTERMCPQPLPEPEKFGGRDIRLREIMDLIRTGEDTAITAVQGLGGIGKTTLARVIAHRLHADKTFHAVLWADITRKPSPIDVLSNWVVGYADSSFDVASFKGNLGQIADAVRVHLNGVIAEKCELCDSPRVLVILDDVWDNGLEAVRIIKRACPDHTTILITTRSENVAIDLGANVQSLAYLTSDETVDFLKSYLSGFDETILERLGSALGGHALALELAARRILKEKRPGESDRDKLARLADEYEHGMTTGSTFAKLKLEQGEQKEDNLTHSLYHSYEMLTSDEQKRFRTLGVLPYDVPFSPDILAVLWQVDDVYDAADTLRLLSLLDADGDQYSQHPLLRAYANALLNESERTSAFNQYTEYIIVQTSRFNQLPLEEWSQLNFLLPHIRYVGDILFDGFQTNPEFLKFGMDFAFSISNYVVRRPESQGTSYLMMGYQISSITQDAQLIAYFSLYLSKYFVSAGGFDTAETLLSEALNLIEAYGNQIGKVAILQALAHLSQLKNDRENWKLYLDNAIDLSSQINDNEGLVSGYSNRARYHIHVGNVEDAEEDLEKAENYNVAFNSLSLHASILMAWGSIFASRDQLDKASGAYNEALKLKRRVGDKSSVAQSLINLAVIYKNNAQLDKANAYLVEAIHIFEEIVNLPELVTAFQWLTLIEYSRNNLENALSAIKNSISIATNINYPKIENLVYLRDRLKSLLSEEVPPPVESLFKNAETIVGNVSFVLSSNSNKEEVIQQIKMLYNQASELIDPHSEEFYEAVFQILQGNLPKISNNNPYIPYLEKIR